MRAKLRWAHVHVGCNLARDSYANFATRLTRYYSTLRTEQHNRYYPCLRQEESISEFRNRGIMNQPSRPPEGTSAGVCPTAEFGEPSSDQESRSVAALVSLDTPRVVVLRTVEERVCLFMQRVSRIRLSLYWSFHLLPFSRLHQEAKVGQHRHLVGSQGGTLSRRRLHWP